MRWRKFAVYDALGAVLWVGTWLTVGYVAGDHIDSAYGAIRHYLIYLMVGAAILIVTITAQHVLGPRRDRSALNPERRTQMRPPRSSCGASGGGHDPAAPTVVDTARWPGE